jgi:hypothetical protein
MPEVRITERNLVEELRSAFPEIEDKYQEELKSWDGGFPGNYNVFAFVFKPLLKIEMAKNENEDFLRRLSAFMERVCKSDDDDAINVIWLKIFKLVLPDKATLKQLWPVLGSATKLNIVDAALRWNLVGNLPLEGQTGILRALVKPRPQG